MKNKVKLLIFVLLIIMVVAIGFKLINNKNKNHSEEIVYNYYGLYQDGLVGIIDKFGNVIIEPEYYDIIIPNPSKDVFICLYNYNEELDTYDTKILNSEKKEIYTDYEDISAIELQESMTEAQYEKNVLKYEKNGKWGLLSIEGKKISEANYDYIENCGKEGYLLVSKNEKYGILNLKGKELIKVEYDIILNDNYYDDDNNYLYSGYIVGNKTDEGYKYGYINYAGKTILKIEYNKVNRVNEIQEGKNVYLIAEKLGKAGLTKNKKQLLDYENQSIVYDELNKVFITEKNEKFGLFSKDGKEILNTEYDNIFIEGTYINAVKDEKTKVYDAKGNELQKLKFRSMIATENENYYITVDSEYNQGVSDKEGNIIIQNKYVYVGYLFDDYFIACLEEGKEGIVNSKDETILDFEYDVIQKINNSDIVQAIKSDSNEMYLYSKNMEQILKIEDAEVSIENDYIMIYTEEYTKYYNFEGKEITNKEIFKNNELISTKENSKYGFMDKSGNIKVECIYDRVTEFNKNGFAGIKKDGLWGVIDNKGNIIQEPIYSIDTEFEEPDFIGKYYKMYSGSGEIFYTNEIN